MDLREERYLFELPYDARLGPNFINHGKDIAHAPRESDWTDFDLQAWLRLDTPPVEGTMCSTTLSFSSASRPTDPMYFVQRAFPRFFAINRAHHISPSRRWLYSRPALWLKDRLRGSGPNVRRTVVEAVRIAERPDTMTNEWKFEQLRVALERLNAFLLAVATVHGDPELAPVSIQDLPPIVYGMGWDLPHSVRKPDEIDFVTYIVNDRIPDRPRKPLTRAEADLAMWLTVERDHPLVAPSHMFLSAQHAQYRGRLTHAILDAGTGVEIMVAAAVRLVAPEFGYSAEKVSKVMQAGFRNIVEDHFAKLLGYSQDPENASDALGVWWQEGYRIRNAVVHEGRRASEDEADEAIGSALQLQRDFTERLKNLGLSSKLPQVPINVKEEADRARDAAGALDK